VKRHNLFSDANRSDFNPGKGEGIVGRFVDLDKSWLDPTKLLLHFQFFALFQHTYMLL